LFGRFRVDATNNPPNAVAAERDWFKVSEVRIISVRNDH